eukprot:TRINITY_DN3173_c0_g1_i2.p1 TRINITY_DN3173_c0_g1~~TRINITY_DN3173_c0_g1_i2.p1  ORF type:complete len:452 (-),score=122.54 TRINITY_DN3173_c0_g1_i2:1480-2757(-)
MVVTHKYKETRAQIIQLEYSYGMLEGGHVFGKLTTEEPEPVIAFAMCSDSEAAQLSTTATKDICANTCTVLSKTVNGEVAIDFVVKKYDVYYFLLFNCLNDEKLDPYIASIELTMLNPDGEHLPCGYMPYPTMFTILFFFWIATAVLWMYSWISRWRKHVLLHDVMSLFPILKFLWCAINVYYWTWYSNNGTSVSTAVDLLYRLGLTSYQACFYSVLVLLGSGWKLLHNSIRRDLPWLIALLVGVIVAVCAQLAGDGSVLQVTVRLGFVIFRVVVVVYVFVTVNRNLRDVEMRVVDMQDPPPGSQIYIDQEQQRMLMSFKAVLVLWLVANMMIYFVLLIFINDWVWVVELQYECLDLLVFICIAIIYRARDISVFWGAPILAGPGAGAGAAAAAVADGPPGGWAQNENLQRRVQMLLASGDNAHR